MDKCREAFEKTPDIAKRISNGVYFNENLKIYREIKGSCRGATFVNGAWCVWQSRQAEVDALKNLLEKDEYAHNLYYENANLQTLVEEKDKRIEAALAIVNKMAKATNSTAMWAYDLEKALRGEHE